MIEIPEGAGILVRRACHELVSHAPALNVAGVHICLSLPDHTSERRAPGHPEGYTISGREGRYHICSKSERGLLYGAYGLLEALGAAWPHPGETRLPAWERWPELDLYVEPSYDQRGTALTGPTNMYEVETLLTWSARRGLNALHIDNSEGLDLNALKDMARDYGIVLTTGPLTAERLVDRCYKHSIGNPYGCDTNRPIFARLAGGTVAAAGYADLNELGRPANLATIIRQDLEDIFRESYRTFFMYHNGPISWWTAPLNFDVYARTLWDLNTDPAEVMVAFANGDEGLERALAWAETAAAAALCYCCSKSVRDEAVASTADYLPDSLERSLHLSDWAAAEQHLQAFTPHQRGRYGDEVLLPLLRRRKGGEL